MILAQALHRDWEFAFQRLWVILPWRYIAYCPAVVTDFASANTVSPLALSQTPMPVADLLPYITTLPEECAVTQPLSTMSPPSLLRRFAPLVLLLAGSVAALYLASGPIAQDPNYHNFADQRPCLCIPHVQNVLTNIPFLFVGLLGLIFLQRPTWHRAFRASGERLPFAFFFLGIFLTGLGSAYYHWNPTNPTLFWDRLPLAGAFMSLFAAVLGERLGRTVGMVLLVPLLGVGLGSVIFWHVTESAGVGDMRPYILVQGYPLLAIPLIILLNPSAYTRGSGYVTAILWYVLAKLLELGDYFVFDLLGQEVSGHALKHLVSALGAYGILHMLRRRTANPGVFREESHGDRTGGGHA